MPSVLIVEDDDYVRECLSRGFVADGWKALQAATPTEALGWVNVQKFDLVVADVMMPGMNGAELVRRIRLLKPLVAALLMSGYPEHYLQTRSYDTRIAPFLQKPFAMKVLIERANALVPEGSDSAGPA